MSGAISCASAVMLATVFGIAGTWKLLDPEAFRIELGSLRLPDTWADAARATPYVECALALSLLVAPHWGLAAAVPTLAAFGVVALRREVGAPGCGCLLPFTSTGRTLALARNAALAVIAVAGLTHPVSRSAAAASAGVLAAFGLVLAETTAALSARSRAT